MNMRNSRNNEPNVQNHKTKKKITKVLNLLCVNSQKCFTFTFTLLYFTLLYFTLLYFLIWLKFKYFQKLQVFIEENE